MKAYNIARAIELANALREAFDHPSLADLPQGIPQDGARCVLARAFNFACRIKPNDLDDPVIGWYVEFDEQHSAPAYKLAELCGTEVVQVQGYTATRYKIPLPKDIGDIANAFDEGLLAKYEQLDEYGERY